MMDQNPLPFEQPKSDFSHLQFPVNEGTYRRNAILGYLLLFGTLGTILAIIGNIIAALFEHFIAASIVNILIPFLIGYQSGKTAIKSDLVDTVRKVSIFGAVSAGLTAACFAVVFCSCAMMTATFLEANVGLFDYLEQIDVSAVLIVLIMLGIMIGGVLFYAAFGAIGAAVAGIRRGIGKQVDFQFENFGEG